MSLRILPISLYSSAPRARVSKSVAITDFPYTVS
nr:MAG TPA: hypothetical protein [Crassvirales sp.]